MRMPGIVAATALWVCGCAGAPAPAPDSAGGAGQPPRTGVRRVTVTPVVSGGPAGRVAFHSDRDGRNRLFILEVATAAVAAITGSPEHRDESPAWSPNCRALAYATTRFDHATYDLAVIDDASDQTPRRVTSHAAFERHPVWAPDGASLFFTSDQDGLQAVFRVTLATGEIRRVSPGRDRTLMGSLAPAGGRMAFVVGSALGLRVAVQEHAEAPAIAISPAGVDAADPRWSPDGTRLAFAHLAPAPGTVGVWNADTGGRHEIVVDGLTEVREPTWSPDGQWLMVAGRTGEDWDLLLVRADGAHAHRVTAGIGNDRAPAWMPC